VTAAARSAAGEHRRGQGQPLHHLARDLSDEIEVVVPVQDDQARKLCCRREQQVRYRGRAVPASVSEQQLDLHRPVLRRRGEVLPRHGGQRHLPARGAQLGANRAEKPTSSSVTVPMRSKPRSSRSAHRDAS